MLNTKVFTHLAIIGNEEIPITEEVAEDYRDRNVPENTIFSLGNIDVRKYKITTIKKMPNLNKGKKANYKRIQEEKEWDRQNKKADDWIKANTEEWEFALKVARETIEKRGYIKLMKSPMLQNVIESQARINCGIAIEINEVS